MPFSYGKKSTDKLLTCHPLWHVIMDEALLLSPYDITIVWGWRGEEVQNAFFESGASHKRWPDSTHNKTESTDFADELEMSDAIDFAPWVDGKIPWKETHMFAVIAGVIMAVAKRRGVKVRWGGDWDSDGSTRDQTLMDFGHIEIIWD